jgi:hypothetical protein
MHHSIFAILMLMLCSCALNNQPYEQEASTLLPDRKETVGFFSSIHKTARETEQGIYGLMYGVRDGIDTFIYDAQKDYYQDYQK